MVRVWLAGGVLASLFLGARSQECESYSGPQCEGYGDVPGGQIGAVEFAVQATLDQISVPWFTRECKAALRKISCAARYEGLACDGTTYCQSDCMELANDACGEYFSEPAFSVGVSSLCALTNSSASCVSTEFEIQTLDADEPICPNPLGTRPKNLGKGETIKAIDNTGCAFPCLNVLFTPDDQRTVREFGVTMSVLSFIFCSVALWVFLSMPDVGRRKSMPATSPTAKSSQPMSRGSMLADLRLGESIQNLAANIRTGRLFAGYSKAQTWKILLVAGAWFNAFVSLIYDCVDIQSPVGCNGDVIIVRYHSLAVFKAMVNFWVHFFSILIMGYLARNLYLSSLGMYEIGPRVEKEFSRVLLVVLASSLLVVVVCASIGQYGYDFGVSAAFMMQTLDRNPLFVIISLLGFLNLVAAAFVVLFLYHVPFTAIPKSARMLVASFMLYFAVSAAFIMISIYVFGDYAEVHAKPAMVDYAVCLFEHMPTASTPKNAGIEACGSYASDHRFPFGMLMYFKLWQSGYSIVTLLAWAPLVGQKVYLQAQHLRRVLTGSGEAPAGRSDHRPESSEGTASRSERQKSGGGNSSAGSVDNDFAKIARTVRKRWDAVKKLAASTAATVTAPVRQSQESGGADAQVIINNDEYEDTDAVKAQPEEQQDEIDRLFEKSRGDVEKEIAMQTLGSDEISKSTADQV